MTLELNYESFTRQLIEDSVLVRTRTDQNFPTLLETQRWMARVLFQ